MAETKFVVLKGQKYLGCHKIYKEGEEFPATELFGNEDNIEMALKGGGPNDAKPRIKVVPRIEKTSKKDKGKDKDK